MARDRVELVRDGFAAFERGGVEALLPYFTEDVAIYSLPEWPEESEYHGHDGARRLIESWTEHFEDWGFEVRSMHAADGHVVALLDMKGRARVSGMALGAELGAVFGEFEGDRIAYIRYYPSWAEALEAAGLEGRLAER